MSGIFPFLLTMIMGMGFGGGDGGHGHPFLGHAFSYLGMTLLLQYASLAYHLIRGVLQGEFFGSSRSGRIAHASLKRRANHHSRPAGERSRVQLAPTLAGEAGPQAAQPAHPIMGGPARSRLPHGIYPSPPHGAEHPRPGWRRR